MEIHMPYGERRVELHLPDKYNISIIEPRWAPALPDPEAALQDSLRNPIISKPLQELVSPGMRVGIIFNDITRPTPNSLILRVILEELSHLPAQDILLFNALGTHRANTDEELRRMLGERMVEHCQIVQNNAFDRSPQTYLGETSFGHPTLINRQLVECDLKILTGFIEPHFFAGFSGGCKAVMPGMAGIETILGNHNARMIGDPSSTWGISDGNPIFEEVREIGEKIGECFLVNVSLNKDKQITGVFSGDVREAHATGCTFVKETAMQPVGEPFDVVVTTNSGYPLDINLYQSVKGMSAAVKIVKKGGAIIIASECRDGIPGHGLYGSLLRAACSPQELRDGILASPIERQDQWEAQIQAQIQLHADVYVYSDGLSDDELRSALLEPVRDITGLVERLVTVTGGQGRICILPEGLQTIPYLEIE
jgi:nickel-dependent lactate racemase